MPPRRLRATTTATLIAAAVVFGPVAVTPSETPSSDDLAYQAMPATPARDDVFGLCGACHSIRLVTQQGLSKSSWSAVLDEMVEDQGMPELDPEERALIMDYLVRFYGPDRKARSGVR